MNIRPFAIRAVISLSLVAAALLVSAQPTDAGKPVPLTAAPLSLPPSLVAQMTISELMKDTIDPAARALWTAVSYVATAEGVTETMPETEEDWIALREKADSLIKAGTMLILPGVKIGDASAETPPYQYTPVEIERLIQQDPGEWRNYADRMQTSVLRLMDAIDRRDLAAYTDLGPPINQACQGCHAQYWYRAMPR